MTNSPLTLPNNNFWLGNDLEKTKARFMNAGFKEVKMWYQPANWLYRDGTEFVNGFLIGNQPQVASDSKL